MITHSELKRLLSYDPESGVFVWLVYQCSRSVIGSVAGGIKSQGYHIIGINGRQYRAHRLAWFYVHGEWPHKDLDHINGARSDNRISNLRITGRSENLANMKKRINKSGYKGVSYHNHSGLWRARISKHNKQYTLGYYASALGAHNAYMKAAKELYLEFARAA